MKECIFTYQNVATILHKGKLLISICNEFNIILGDKNFKQITLSFKFIDERRVLYTLRCNGKQLPS